MKTIRFFLSLILLTGISLGLAEQSKSNTQVLKTETFKVWGNCESCKTRIEKAATEAGAVTASWDQKTKMLTVSFDPEKTSVDALQKKLASVGHDTEKYKAPDDVYAKLPGCCHYERAK